jgi:hypothetical protein
LNETQVLELLNHIHSLHVVSVPDQIGHADVKTLLKLGYIRLTWINAYALTPEGERARKELAR